MHSPLTEIQTLVDSDQIIIRAETAGDITICHVCCQPGADLSPFVKDLPDGACPCIHWGYVSRGEFIIDYTDGRSERVREGEAFHVLPGHVFRAEVTCEFIEFTATEELNRMFAHVAATLARDNQKTGHG